MTSGQKHRPGAQERNEAQIPVFSGTEEGGRERGRETACIVCVCVCVGEGEDTPPLRSDCKAVCPQTSSAWVIMWEKNERPDQKRNQNWEDRES